MKDAGFAAEFRYQGELDRVRKIEFLRDLDVMSVPCTYDEPKGFPYSRRWPTAYRWCSRGGERFRRFCSGPAAGYSFNRTMREAWRRQSTGCGRTASGSRNWGEMELRESASTTASLKWRRGALEVYRHIASAAVTA